MILERYSFVALTTTNLEQARRFWVDQLEFPVTREEAGRFFMVDAGTLRLCIDLPEDDVGRSGGTDPVIGFKVASLADSLAGLAARGVRASRGPITAANGRYAELRDPDGRTVILTETD
jgi:catechol 2,3-dioxygenase-like lactoylglutathione lyase family enzyme